MRKEILQKKIADIVNAVRLGYFIRNYQTYQLFQLIISSKKNILLPRCEW